MTTTGASLPALYGAIGSLFSPALYSVLISQYRPYKFDWREFLRIELAEEAQTHNTSQQDEVKQHEGNNSSSDAQTASRDIFAVSDTENDAANTDNKKSQEPVTITSPSTLSLDDLHHPFDAATLRHLRRWYRIAWAMFAGIVLVTFVLWPMPLYRDYIFTKTFFKSWTTVAIVWQFFAFFAVVIYPLYDGRYEILKSVQGAWKDGRRVFSSK
ncbi:hypothetical protein QQX98_003223 [Neonectria punicea]|uniref:Uncharacterized protein n=1 Tax=Neonectria punicea TaxID=979145 RepID=A0ABR1HFB5_9HYPO